MTRDDIGRLERAARNLAGPLVAAARRRRRVADQAKASAQPRPPVATAKTPARTKPPLLSVVVAAEDDDHLEECLASLAAQTLSSFEVVVVGAQAALAPWVAERPGVRLVDRPASGGLPGARNRGVAAAHGTYLAFLDGGDTVPKDGFAALVRVLRRSGSDFAVGDSRLVHRGRSRRTDLPPVVHELDRIGVTVDAFPMAMRDVALGNRVFRRSFWDDHIGGFDETTGLSDLEATVTGYLRARSFDLVKKVTHHRQLRRDTSSLLKKTDSAVQLADRVNALERLWKLVAAEASPAVAGSWLGSLMETDLARWAAHAATADEDYRRELQRACHDFFDAGTPETWPHVQVSSRLRIGLAKEGRWDALELLVDHLQVAGATPPTRLVDGRVLVDLSSAPDLGPGIPDLCFELAESQTGMAACVRSAWFAADGTLVVDGWAFVRAVDLTDGPPEQRAVLVDTETGDEVPVPLESRPDPLANRWAQAIHQDVANGGFRLRIDPDALPAPDPATGRRYWQLRMEVAVGRLVRSGVVSSAVRTGSGQRMRARALRDPLEPVRLMPVLDPVLGFALQARVDHVRALELVADQGGVVRGRLRVLENDAPRLVRLHATASSTVITAELEDGPGPEQVFTLRLPDGPAGERWTVQVVDEAGQRHRVSWPAESEAGAQVAAADASVVWLRSPRGLAGLESAPSRLVAEAVDVGATTVAVRGWAFGLDRQALAAARLTSHRMSVGVENLELGEDGAVRLVFPLQGSLWGGPTMPLPAGSYTVQLDPIHVDPIHVDPGQLDPGQLPGGQPDPQRAQVTVTDALLERCPDEGGSAAHRYTIGRAVGTDQLEVTLRAPLLPDERGRHSTRRLADWYATADVAPVEAVLMSCYRGEFATDSQLALHQELWRRGTGLRLLWGVSDYSVVLPEGAEPLLIGSRAWFTALASSRYLCHNIDMERWFRKRPYQRYLQTFHGYPFKSMGASLWRAQGKGERLIQQESRRRSEAWDAIVVPEDFCVELYRREYGFTGEALVTGYPRNDALVRDASAATRSQVLARLGVPVDTTVVLYAPTWRDTASISAYRADLFDGLDLDGLVAQLGPGYTVLIRGHNYNLRGGSRAASSAVLDVSGYPEVNDLILAADVAVLDYSSLRFDWLITGKPVAFYVPDLDDYVSSRRVLFDYAATAPGPLVRTLPDLVAVLQDLDGLTRGYAEERAAANLRFNRLHDGHASERLVDAFFS